MRPASWLLKLSSKSASASVAGRLFHSGMVRVVKEWRNSSVLVRCWNSFQECGALVREDETCRPISSDVNPTYPWMMLYIMVSWRISCGLLASRAPVLPASPSLLKLLCSPGWSSRQLCAVCVQECPCPSQDVDPRQLRCIQPVTSQVWRRRFALVALGSPWGSSWGNPTGCWLS